MFSYEIFTEYYSKIVQANSINEAMMEFNRMNKDWDEIIAIIKIEHPIYKEMIAPFNLNYTK